MNYRHLYHAGNFADVFKHVLLLALLKRLTEKERPLCYVDTHAGAGLYALNDTMAKKSGEADEGIRRVVKAADMPELVSEYARLVHSFSAGGAQAEAVNRYPGSPLIAARLLRPQDKLILVEREPPAHTALSSALRGDKRVALHKRDAYEALGALLPPPQPRGMVLVDPPFEDAAEFGHLTKVLPLAMDRWNTGVFCLWYPVKDRIAVDRMERALIRKAGSALRIHCALEQSSASGRMRSCGLLVLRPPQGLEASIRQPMQWLMDRMSDSATRRLEIST